MVSYYLCLVFSSSLKSMALRSFGSVQELKTTVELKVDPEGDRGAWSGVLCFFSNNISCFSLKP